MNKEFLSELGVSQEAADEIIAKFNEELGGVQLGFEVEKALKKRGAKSISAAMKLINLDGLAFTNGEVLGLDERIEDFVKENDFLFGKGDTKPMFSRRISSTSGITKDEFDKMGYEKRLMLFNENPEVYKKLAGN